MQVYGAFSNPIVGSGGQLVRESIRSPNYVPGVSGWTINKDGTASFNSTTINGDLKVVGTNGSVVWIRNADDHAVIEIYPPTPLPALVPAKIQGRAVFADLPSLNIYGPTFTGFSYASIELHTELVTDEAYIGLIAQRFLIQAVSGQFVDSIMTVNVETVIADATRTITGGELRNTLLPNLLTAAWVGAKDGQFAERDGAGNAVATRRFEDISAVTTASGTYVANPAATTEGIAFRAASSGNHTFKWAAGMSHSVAAGATLVSFELRIGATIGSGTVVIAASDDRAIENNGTNRQYGSFYDFVGLSPGQAYNVRLMYRTGAGATATIIRRRMTVSPILY